MKKNINIFVLIFAIFASFIDCAGAAAEANFDNDIARQQQENPPLSIVNNLDREVFCFLAFGGSFKDALQNYLLRGTPNYRGYKMSWLIIPPKTELLLTEYCQFPDLVEYSKDKSGQLVKFQWQNDEYRRGFAEILIVPAPKAVEFQTNSAITGAWMQQSRQLCAILEAMTIKNTGKYKFTTDQLWWEVMKLDSFKVEDGPSGIRLVAFTEKKNSVDMIGGHLYSSDEKYFHCGVKNWLFPASVIASMKKIIIQPKDAVDWCLNYFTYACPICNQSLAPDSGSSRRALSEKFNIPPDHKIRNAVTPCGHVVHELCLWYHLAKNMGGVFFDHHHLSCPQCRRPNADQAVLLNSGYDPSIPKTLSQIRHDIGIWIDFFALSPSKDGIESYKAKVPKFNKVMHDGDYAVSAEERARITSMYIPYNEKFDQLYHRDFARLRADEAVSRERKEKAGIAEWKKCFGDSPSEFSRKDYLELVPEFNTETNNKFSNLDLWLADKKH